MKISEMTDVEKLALGSLVRVIVGVDGKYTAEESTGLRQAAEELGEDDFWQVVDDSAHEHHTEEIVKDQARAVDRKEAQETIYGVLFSIATAGSIAREEGDVLDWLAGTWSLTTPS